MRASLTRWASRCVYTCSVTVVCAVLAACGGGSSGAAPTATDGSPPTSTGSGPNAAGFPVTIQNCGHTLTFNSPPSRVMLPYQPQAEIVVGLGLGDKAIGRAGWKGGLKQPPILPEQAADFARIPVVSDTNYPPPKEKLLSLHPDFLLAFGDFDYGGKNQGADGLATYDELAAAGVKAYTVVCPPEKAGDYKPSLDATYRTILDLGKIFGVSGRAEQRVAQMKAQIADVSQKVSGQPRSKVIAYGGGQGPLSLSGGGPATLTTQMIQAAGAENVFADQQPFFEASLETVAGKQADAFLIYASAKNAGDTLDATTEKQFLFTTFPSMKASKDRRVIVTDYMFTSPGWRNAQTVEEFARQLHPDAFK